MENGDVIVTRLIARLSARQEPSAKPLRGAEPEDIADLEAALGLRLPAVYRRFLEVMGRSAGPLFRGSDYSLDQRHRLRLRPSAERIIARTGTEWRLPDDAFVFLMHHGYQFLFFRCGEGSDPPVYRFSDADQAPSRIADSFTQFVERELDLHEWIVQKSTANEQDMPVRNAPAG